MFSEVHERGKEGHSERKSPTQEEKKFVIYTRLLCILVVALLPCTYMIRDIGAKSNVIIVSKIFQYSED